MLGYIIGTGLIGICLGMGGAYLYIKRKNKKEKLEALKLLNSQEVQDKIKLPKEVSNDRQTRSSSTNADARATKPKFWNKLRRRKPEAKTSYSEPARRTEYKKPVERERRNELPDFSSMV